MGHTGDSGATGRGYILDMETKNWIHEPIKSMWTTPHSLARSRTPLSCEIESRKRINCARTSPMYYQGPNKVRQRSNTTSKITKEQTQCFVSKSTKNNMNKVVEYFLSAMRRPQTWSKRGIIP